jgi:hypothetical protein
MANNRYDMSLTKIKEFQNSQERTINLHRKDNRPIEIAEITNICEKFIPNDAKYMVRALNAKSWVTLKGFSEPDINLMEYQDYYKNKVADPSKFDKFFQLSVTVIQKK